VIESNQIESNQVMKYQSIGISLFTHVYACNVCMCMCVILVYVCMQIYIMCVVYVYVYVHVCMCMCKCKCMCMCMYMCMCKFTLHVCEYAFVHRPGTSSSGSHSSSNPIRNQQI